MIQTIRGLLRDATPRVGYAVEASRLIWQAAKGWTVAWAILLLIAGLLPTATVYLTKLVVDAFAESIGQGLGWSVVETVAVPTLLMVAVLILQRVASSIQEWVSVGQAEHVSDYLKNLLHTRAAAADFAFYESSSYHDLLEQANSQAGTRVLQLTRDAGSLVQAAVGFLSLGFLLFQYGWVIPAVLVVGALPAFVVLLKFSRISHAWWHRSTALRRRAQYYDMMVASDAGAAEVRMNQLGSIFRRKYQEVRKTLRSEQLDILRRQLSARVLAALLALGGTGIAMWWVGSAALRGEATIGDLALFYSAFNQGQNMVGAVLRSAGQLYTNTLFLEQVFTFLNFENEVVDPETPTPFPGHIRDGVVFENITFRYPGSERPALEEFSLSLPAGKMVAIVGENGAGKSTLIKLLCRFYDPEVGRVLVDGVDIRDFEIDSLRKHVSVMFQFPMRYQMTAHENISLGNLKPGAEEIASGGSRADIDRAAREAGATDFIEHLPSGYDTLLGRWFSGGTELSGGEWQRVALARAFLRKAPIIVLDEPTSFMDSWAENEWVLRFKAMVQGRTSLIITHRFTTAMQADIIHVIEDGEIIETGSHSELVRRDGKYARSWTTQMERAAAPDPADDDASLDVSPVGPALG